MVVVSSIEKVFPISVFFILLFRVRQELCEPRVVLRTRVYTRIA